MVVNLKLFRHKGHPDLPLSHNHHQNLKLLGFETVSHLTHKHLKNQIFNENWEKYKKLSKVMTQIYTIPFFIFLLRKIRFFAAKV
jgi:hypothetical protein